MDKKQKFRYLLLVLFFVVFVSGLAIYARNADVLNPAGHIAERQKQLLVFGVSLSLIVIIPVFALTIYIATTYREGNKKANYQPNWDRHAGLELVWWAIPIALILIMSVVTWRSSHELDPFKPLASQTKPIKIQVVALDWKWLFLYPEQGIASVNYVRIPENTPIDFEITSDAPMNSFWIPALGGQIYAMSGMATQLHLVADKTGSYYGSSANISGEGFAGMNFKAEATTNTDFLNWVYKQRSSNQSMDLDNYNNLAKPSKNIKPTTYNLKDRQLFGKIMNKFMFELPNQKPDNMSYNKPHNMDGMSMEDMNHMHMEGAR